MIRLFVCLCIVLVQSIAYAEHAQPLCPEFPFFQPKTGPLAAINCDFHHGYEDRIKQIEQTFGAVNGRPVMMNLGGTLILKYHGATETAEITPSAYHNIKAYSHIAFTLYLLLSQQPPGRLEPIIVAKLQKLQKDTEQAMALLPTLDLTPEAKFVISKLTKLSSQFLNKILLQRSWSQRELLNYYKEATPLVNQTVQLSANIELQTLDQVINKWLSRMSKQEITTLGIVVAESHQPRAQELSLQYFAKKFGYHFGEGALYEKGLVVLEGHFDEKSALSLLARHYLDREAAKPIFNDPDRLQRDLLADAAKKTLSEQTAQSN